MRHIRAAVVGAGIIGLATARELLDRVPGSEAVVFEKEDAVAAHQTGRNSGVVHAGLYYEPGGLKARLCRRGAGLLRSFAREKGIAYEECGKIVVAEDEVQRERLQNIHHRATANGVPGVDLLDAAGIEEIEPSAAGIAALHSPQTAIVDFAGVARALAEDIAHAGGQVRLGEEVIALGERPGPSGAGPAAPGPSGATAAGTGAAGAAAAPTVRVATEAGVEDFDLVIVCAGLQSDRLARSSGESAHPRIVPFFGDYFMLSAEKAAKVNGLIYPVPDPKYPFLGVHITRRYDGEVMLGPNAFLSWGREVYRRRGADLRDLAEVMSFPGFWRFAAQNIPAAMRETRTAVSRRAFVAEAKRYMPEIGISDVFRGPRGVRAQAMHADGSLADDFVITGGPRLVHIRNAPSPGATSALAIAEHIVGETLRRRTG